MAGAAMDMIVLSGICFQSRQYIDESLTDVGGNAYSSCP